MTGTRGFPLPNSTHLRVALLCSYPTWPHREALELRRDARHVTSTWNVNLARFLALRNRSDVHVFTLAAGIPRTCVLRPEARLWLHFVSMPRWLKGLDLLAGLRFSTRILGREVGRIRPNLVHGIGTEHPYAAVATRLNLPSVVTVHGVMTRVVEQMAPPPWSPQRFFARLERRTLDRARHVVTINPYVREKLRMGRETRTYRVENAIDPVFFDHDRVAHRREGLVFVGMIQPRKGVDVLLDALAQLAPEHRREPVQIVGPVIPDHKKHGRELENVARKLGLDGIVHWRGALDPPELAEVLRRARALVLPSREETAPMVIAEALACGTPVVATDVGGVRHMIQDGVTGFVVPPERPDALAKGIVRVLSLDPTKTGHRAREEARRYHPERIAAATEKVYREVLAHET